MYCGGGYAWWGLWGKYGRVGEEMETVLTVKLSALMMVLGQGRTGELTVDGRKVWEILQELLNVGWYDRRMMERKVVNV